jgi:hypothetical protein
METSQTGSVIFGIIIGYISWQAIFKNESNLSMKTVATFIGVVGGAGITTLFPDKSNLFDSYCIGLGCGFFFTPIFARIEKVFEQFKMRQMQKDESAQKELDYILKNWDEIDEFVKEKLKKSALFIDVDKLQELPYSRSAKVFIMMEYARRHVHEGLTFEHTSFGPWLQKF